MATLGPTVTLTVEATAEGERDKEKPDVLRTAESITPILDCLTPSLFHGRKEILFRPLLLYILYYKQPDIILTAVPNYVDSFLMFQIPSICLHLYYHSFGSSHQLTLILITERVY